MPNGPIQSLPAAEVFQTFINDFQMDKGGQRHRSPWQKDALPDEIAKSPVEWYIFNVGPIKQIINAGSMGQFHLLPPAEGKDYNEPLKITRYMIDWADQGDYKHKAIIMDGATVAREWVTPCGEKGNTDLRNWGVFATKNNPPTKAEIDAAQTLLRRTLDALIDQGDTLYADQKTRSQITPVYHTALVARKKVRPWHGESKEMQRCEGCGKAVEADVAKCSCGAIRDWNKARKLRLVSRDEYEEAVRDGLVAGVTVASLGAKPVAPTK